MPRVNQTERIDSGNRTRKRAIEVAYGLMALSTFRLGEFPRYDELLNKATNIDKA
jgi:hypothetical protein